MSDQELADQSFLVEVEVLAFGLYFLCHLDFLSSEPRRLLMQG